MTKLNGFDMADFNLTCQNHLMIGMISFLLFSFSLSAGHGRVKHGRSEDDLPPPPIAEKPESNFGKQAPRNLRKKGRAEDDVVIKQEPPKPTEKIDLFGSNQDLSDEAFMSKIRTPPPKYDPILHVVIPSQIPETGAEIQIRVSLAEPGMCYCMIGDQVFSGTLDAEGMAKFKAPSHNPGRVSVQFSKDGINWFGNVELEYVAVPSSSKKYIFIGVGAAIACIISYVLYTFLTGNKKKARYSDGPSVFKSRSKSQAYSQYDKAPVLRSAQML